jgi:hypothetical protein
VHIQLDGTNLCAAVYRSPAGVGDPIVLLACADSPTQNFDFSHDAQVRESASQLCANVLGGKPLPGSSLGMWDGCDDPANSNERFHLSGRIVSAALGGVDGQCAAWDGDTLGDAVTAQVRPCTPAPAPVPQQDGTTWLPIDPQNWDVYWP